LSDVDKVTSAAELMAEGQVCETSVDESIVQEYHRALLDDADVVGWLLQRGVTRESIVRFRLGKLREGMKSWLTIPYYKKKRPVNMKFRSLPPAEREFKVLKDHETPLFNVDALNLKQPVFVTEGEFDAIVLIQEGYENTVSVPMGAKTFTTEHFDSLISGGRLNLVFDSDAAGRDGARRVAERLGEERCYLITLPTKDVSDFFQRFHRPDFEALLAESRPAGRSVVQSIGEVFKDLERRRSVEESTLNLPWRNVSKIVGSLRPGWLVILQAIPKIGKTTFATQVMFELARSKGVPTLYYSLEMAPDQLLERLISSVREVAVSQLSHFDVVMAKGELYKVPLYFGSARGALSAERVYETIRYAVKRFGIRALVFDHLHFLCRDIARVTSEVGKVVRDFKLLFEELKIPGIVITHPTKMSPDVIPGIYGSRDSGEIAGDADVLISLFRHRMRSDSILEEDFQDSVEPTFESRTLVRVAASRYVSGGSAVLFFNSDSMRFEESGSE
jgi:twinkle protein